LYFVIKNENIDLIMLVRQIQLVNYPALMKGASLPHDEDFLRFLSAGSKGSPDPARRIFREALYFLSINQPHFGQMNKRWAKAKFSFINPHIVQVLEVFLGSTFSSTLRIFS
jgi:hypothetical protein